VVTSILAFACGAQRRRAADRGARDPAAICPAWTLGAGDSAIAVVAHAQHGRLGLVAEITDALPALLSTLTAEPGPSADTPAESYPGLTIWGLLLLALAMMDLDRARRAGDERAATLGARMIALAERFGFGYGFRATMSPARARQAAQDAAGPAYDDAVSSYAGLGPKALRAAVRAALAARAQATVEVPRAALSR